MNARQINQIDALHASPASLIRAWPATLPLFALHSGRLHPHWSRYTILTAPGEIFRIEQDGRASLNGGDSPGSDFGAGPLLALRRLLADRRVGAVPNGGNATQAGSVPPFNSGWIGFFAYEFGHVLEPAVRAQPAARSGESANRAAQRHGWPLVELARCDGALIYDALEDRWLATGAWAEALPSPVAVAVSTAGQGPGEGSYDLGPLRSAIDRPAHEAAVARAIEYIHAGDIFQANVTRQLRAAFRGDSRLLFLRAAAEASAWYGGYLELPGGRALLSLSPELFLQVEADGQVFTRPIKGTRPAASPAAELAASEKDTAELHMIVDLCRNDLGRVCEAGSVRVSEARTIESHPTVHHGVATIAGRLRRDRDLCDLLTAAFPGGSVTGAPKIRAMQIIEELESEPRGPYCGCIGFLDDNGAARLNIAIRTLTLTERRVADSGAARVSRLAPGRFVDAEAAYGVGGGVVADSDPAAEYQETEAKAAVLWRLVGRHVPYLEEAGVDLDVFAKTACPLADLPL